MNRFIVAAALFIAALAVAHVGTNAPIFANATQEIFFTVGHGKDNADTSSVRIQIPAGVTAVRAANSDFGKPVIERGANGEVSAVTWTKPDADLLETDYGYYKLALRVRTPNAPFTTLNFLTTQTAKFTDGGTTQYKWFATTPAEIDLDAGIEEAPAVRLLPARRPGWNKYTVPAAITNLSQWFGDAAIVWKGTAAYSANAETMNQINMTSGVSALSMLSANDEIWVKY
ncbi:MAG: DUF1775 domain-containing protein [Myxococcaceae bacterium]|nr:DUF1775 domain-containing protein [Myxococcaceae bacterium]